jgi:hypothetical protein
VSAVRIGVRPPVTVAAVTAALVTTEQVLTRAGWTQYQADDPHGRVCLHRAVDVATDPDRTLAFETRAALLDALHRVFGRGDVDLVVWNDRDGRTLSQVLMLLRATRLALVPAGAAA